tara:strand:- start:453 stop:1106 length:654 start_codon:yes stop_codon:yes gene_type:complete
LKNQSIIFKKIKSITILHITFTLFGIFLFLAISLLIYSFLIPRPLDTTDPSIFLGDGKTVNYCDLPKLDGFDKSSNDIPKAYTPGCGLSQIPMPILAECSEPLAEGVVDMRGLWQGISGRKGFLERIEQCGNRVVVTGHNLIHDFRLDGTLRNGARDVGPACENFNSAILFKDEVMTFRLFNLFDTVTRRLDGEDMIFTFIDGEETRAKRLCKYPED